MFPPFELGYQLQNQGSRSRTGDRREHCYELSRKMKKKGVSLPNKSDVKKAFSSLEKGTGNNEAAEENWRSICLSALSYATEYNISLSDVNSPTNSSTSQQSGAAAATTTTSSTPSKLNDRAKEVVQLLTPVLTSNNSPQSSSPPGQESQEQLVHISQSILIDSFWLVSTMLSSSDVDNEPYLALIEIVKGLSQALSSSSPFFDSQLQITLDPTFLESCGLLPSFIKNQTADTFTNKIKKYQSQVFFKQMKFNVLSEESEGYAKVISFLFSPMNILKIFFGAAIVDSKMKENNPTTYHFDTHKQHVVTHIRGLMGAFNLDPNRVLDLLLESIEAVICDQENKVSEYNTEVLLKILFSVLKDFKEENIPHLLCFKLSPYIPYTPKKQKEGEKPAPPPPPPPRPTPKPRKALLQLCAHLICSGIVQLKDLVPHFKSCIIDLAKKYMEFKKNEKNRIRKLGSISLNANNKKDGEVGGENNATQEAANNDDDDNSKDCENIILSLIGSLLTMGAWDIVYSSADLFLHEGFSERAFGNKNNSGVILDEAMHFISHACVLSPKYIGGSICRILHRVIEPVYETFVRSESLFFAETTTTEQSNKTSEEEHQQKMKQIERIENLSTEIFIPLMSITDSGCIQDDPALYCKLCRLFKIICSRATSAKSSEDTTKIDNYTMVILCRFLVPSLSLFASNPAISSELWSCIKVLPYDVRYQLYDCWKGQSLEKEPCFDPATQVSHSCLTNSKPLVLVESEVNTGIECRKILKRICKENAKEKAKQIAKTSHNNPIVVFTKILSQIETYDNLITLMVDAFKNLTKLSLDIVGYCLLQSLGGGSQDNKRKKSSNGMNKIQWLTSLSQFVGAFYKKFPEVESRGMLFFIIGEVQQGETTELTVLRNLLTTAGGYDFADSDNFASLSKIQLEGRAGSQLLKRETSSFGVVEKLNKKSSKRLREVLLDEKTGLQLLVCLAQMRVKIMYETHEGKKEHLKLIGNKFDLCHTILNLLLEFLTDPTDEESNSNSAIIKYGEILPTLDELSSQYKLSLTSAWMLCRPLIRGAIFHSQTGKKKKSEEIPEFLLPYSPTSETMLSTYEKMIPSYLWSSITPLLFHNFWSYSLYDISCPVSRYESEVLRLKKESERLVTLQKEVPSSIVDRDMPSQVFTQGDKQELERVNKNAEVLTAEMKIQKDHCSDLLRQFTEQKTDYFSDNKAENLQCFLSTCVLRRCVLSPQDAIYCAKFIFMLHDIQAEHFSIIQFLDILIDSVSKGLYCVTENEAACTGFLLLEIWTKISEWRYNEGKFSLSDMSHTEYIEYYKKLHSALGTTLIGCLQSKEYINIRAALVVLLRIVEVFPTRPNLGEQLFKHLEPLQDEKSRPDIKTMAQAYESQLDKARKDGVWREQDAAKAKKIMEEEKLKAVQRKREAEQRIDEMKKENERQEIEANRRANGYKFGSNLNASSPVFTPPNNGPSRELYQSSSVRDGKYSGQRNNDRGIGDSQNQGRHSNQNLQNPNHINKNQNPQSNNNGSGVRHSGNNSHRLHRGESRPNNNRDTSRDPSIRSIGDSRGLTPSQQKRWQARNNPDEHSSSRNTSRNNNNNDPSGNTNKRPRSRSPSPYRGQKNSANERDLPSKRSRNAGARSENRDREKRGQRTR